MFPTLPYVLNPHYYIETVIVIHTYVSLILVLLSTLILTHSAINYESQVDA